MNYEYIDPIYLGKDVTDADIEYLNDDSWGDTTRYWKNIYARPSGLSSLYLKGPKSLITKKALLLACEIKKHGDIEVFPAIIRVYNGYHDKSSGEPYNRMLVKDDLENRKDVLIYFPTKHIKKNMEISINKEIGIIQIQ